MQDKDYKAKTDEIKKILNDISMTTKICAENFEGCYFDYDAVLKQLKKANEILLETYSNTKLDAIKEKRATESQDNLLQNGKIFKIRFFNTHGAYFSETVTFNETDLEYWIHEATLRVTASSNKAAGWTAFKLERDSFINGVRNEPTWMPYRPDGGNEICYDTGRRGDHIAKDCKSNPKLPPKQSPMMF
jgi:hypothetical protein